MKKKLLSLAIAGALGTFSLSANALLVTGSVLDFTGTFSLDTGPVAGLVTTPIHSGPDGGIHIGITQDTNGHYSHGGTSLHLTGGLDMEWTFWGNTGMHFTTSPVVVVDNDVNNDGGFTKTLDFSGWRVTWNGIPTIIVGGFQDCGSSTDGICVDEFGTDVAGTYDNGTGLATITCSTASCSNSSTFTLTYSAVIVQAAPSGFGGTPYSLSLTGHVTEVPIPAAAWLFGSGLAGLLALGRRRQRR